MKSLNCFSAQFVIAILLSGWSLGTSNPTDLNQTFVRTVEWLTDYSTVIVIVEESDNSPSGFKILSTLKGDPETLEFPLRKYTTSVGRSYFRPDARGRIKLLFVKGRSTLVQQVGLARPAFDQNRLVFGVDQFGKVLLTQTDFLDAIESRLAAGKIERLAKVSRKGAWAGEAFGKIVPSPSCFPLDLDDEMHLLIVPWTVDRRDHYVEVLKKGRVDAQMDAVRQLFEINDEISLNAIKSVESMTTAKAAFQYEYGDKNRPRKYDLNDLKAKAATFLRLMKSYREQSGSK